MLFRRLIIGIGLAIVLASCSISPHQATDLELGAFADKNLANVTANQEKITRPIDLYEAMARALKYNLDYKVELMEKAVRLKRLDLANYKLLPDLVSNSGYAGRSNYSGSHSTLLSSGKQGWFQNKNDLGGSNDRANTSQELNALTQQVSFTWHVLDFGLSYVRAKQQANEVLIANEMKRKVINRVIEDVRTAFWRTVSSQRLIKKLNWLEGRVAKALKQSRTLYKLKQTSPITALTYERELIEIRREIQSTEGDLKVAKNQLGALMNVRPGEDFTLVQPERNGKNLRLKMRPDEMVGVAMRNRPELREMIYRDRINQREADAALLELLPGLQLYANVDVDSNDYLFNNHWMSWGAKASWNLIRLFQYPARKGVVESQGATIHQRSLAITMAVMTQVYVSRVRFKHYQRELKTAAEYLNVQRRLVKQIRAEARASRVSEQTLVREEMNTIVAEVKFDIAYAHLQNAYANLFTSMGINPYAPDFDENASVKTMARSLRNLWIERGDYKSGSKLAHAK